MDALKKRVDPLGLRNLVWRPQGANRIEIEMPLAPEAGEAPEIKEKFNAAQKDLYQTMIRQDDVVNAVEHLTGSQRTQALAGFASDSKTRANLFKNLCDTFDEIQKLRANQTSCRLRRWRCGFSPSPWHTTSSRIRSSRPISHRPIWQAFWIRSIPTIPTRKRRGNPSWMI